MADDLRQRAEGLLDTNPVAVPVVSTVDVQKVVHELQVHQVELEMQNDELHRAQFELAESRDAYVDLYDFAPVGYVTLDVDGILLEANLTASIMLGMVRGDLVGRKFSEFVVSDSQDEWFRHRREVLTSEDRQSTDLTLHPADRAPFIARLESRSKPAGTPKSWRCMMALVDISAQHRAEVALRQAHDELEQLVSKRTLELSQSDKKYRMLFDAETDAVLLVDGETGTIVDANRSAQDTYGYSHEQFLDLSLDDISAEPEASAASVLQALKEGHSQDALRYHRKKDGDVFPVEISASTFTWQSRPLVCGVIRDISERLRREKEIEDGRAELRRLALELSLAEERERSRIAEELHDELGQMLSACRIRMDVLKQSPLPEKASRNVDSVRAILDRAIDCTRTLTFELNTPMLNQLGLGPSLEQLCIDMSKESGIGFTFHGHPQPIPMSDERRLFLYRCARELLVNVEKHSEAERANLMLEQTDRVVRIRVDDDGVGFDSSAAGMGFSPSGGFGLFNIQEYIQHTGGRLLVESNPDEGTLVTLEAPMEEIAP